LNLLTANEEFEMKKLLTGITLIAGASLASAENNVYGEIAYLPFNYDETVYGTTYTTSGGSAVRGIIGVDIEENLALEAMLGTGMSNATTTISGYTVNLKLNSIYGFYVKPKVNVGEKATLFARIGYAQVSGTTSISSLSYNNSSTNNSISYGIGMSYKMNEKLSVNADYMYYYNKDSATATGLALGIGFRF